MRYDRPFVLPGQPEDEAAKAEAEQSPPCPPGAEPGKGRLRGSLVAVVVAVAAALGVWMWMDSDSRAAHSAKEEARRIAQSSEAYVVMDDPAPEPYRSPEKSPPARERSAGESAVEPPPEPETTPVDPAPDIERHAQVVEAMEQGQHYTAIGRHAAAASHYAEAAQLDPDNASVRYKLALAYVRAGQTASARREMAKLEELDPSLASLLGNLLR
jgi:tetratricopeptide (TPR) repeat protein